VAHGLSDGPDIDAPIANRDSRVSVPVSGMFGDLRFRDCRVEPLSLVLASTPGGSPLLYNHEGALESAPLLCPDPLLAEEFALGTGGEAGPYATERRARPHL